MAKHLNDIITVTYGNVPRYQRLFTFHKELLKELIPSYKEIENSGSKKSENSCKKERISRIRETAEYLSKNNAKKTSIENILRIVPVSNELMRTYLHQIEYDCETLKK